MYSQRSKSVWKFVLDFIQFEKMIVPVGKVGLNSTSTIMPSPECKKTLDMLEIMAIIGNTYTYIT